MNPTILIVDDEPDILDSIALSLELDYEVLTATNGADGLDLLAKHQVALIISDQRMPKMTGVEFLAQAQVVSPDSVRMMLTGFADFDAIIEAVNKGQIYRYISKPWEPTDLEMDVRQAIERYEMQASLTRRMNELQALCDIGATITSVLDSEQVMQKILSGIVDTLGFDQAYLMTVDEEDQTLCSAGSYGVSGEALTFLSQLQYDLNRDDVGVVLTVKENRPILVEDVDNPQIQLDSEAIQKVGFRSFVTAPLRAGERRIGVLVADRSGAGERVTEHDQQLLVGFANQAAIALENARLYEEAVEKKRLEAEVGVAAEIQTRLLPAKLPVLEGYEIAAMTRPSRGVSGDYYDVVEMDDGRVWIALGDVSGKGIPAALTMATLRTLFRTQVEHHLEPADMMQRIADGLFQATSPEVFATFYFGLLDVSARTFVYVNAGHPFPVLARASGETVELDGVGLPVGMDPMLWGDTYEARQVELSPGDALVIFSDGISEAGASHEDMFGEERILDVVTTHRELGASRIQSAVCDAVDTFMQGQPMDDDLTLVALSVR